MHHVSLRHAVSVAAIVTIAATATTGGASQEARAILLREGPVNASIAGSSWWMANHSLTVTWDVTAGIRVSSVYDRRGGRAGTKPGETFTLTLADGRLVAGSTCRVEGPPAVDDIAGPAGAPPGRRLAATFVCASGEVSVRWQASLLPGADVVRQTAAIVRGVATLVAEDIGYPAGSVIAGAPVEPSRARILAGPYLQNPSPSSMTVMWVTDGAAAAWVEYGTDGATALRAVPISDGLVEAGGRIHTVRIEGLRPGTRYTYRAVTRPILNYGPYTVDYGPIVRGETHTFQTLSPGSRPFSFVVLNDLHENVDIMRAHMTRASEKPYDLVFLNGDSLSHLENDAQILERNIGPASDLFGRHVPFFLVRGNHETRGQHARALKRYLALPGGRYYYSFDHGPVHFIVMDTGEDKEDGHWAYSGLTDFDAYREAEARWLKEEVQTTAFRQATFRVLVAHIPFYGNARTRASGYGPTRNREQFGAILNEAGLDLHIAGHTHRSDWVEPAAGANQFPISIGGGSQPGTNTLTRVDVSPDRLVVTLTTDDGKPAGTHTVMTRQR